MDNKTKIINLLKKVNREGIENLIKFMQESDYFTAPASTKYHLNEEGGLATHCINVYKRLYQGYSQRAKELTGSTELDSATKESIVIVALAHDLCKCNFYKSSFRNQKNEETGEWEKIPVYTVQDQSPLGHGEKSVILLLQLGVKLTEEEIYAIRWHMGGFDEAVRGGFRNLSEVYNRYELAYLLNRADMDATYLDEK
jgi:hypothetical protein